MKKLIIICNLLFGVLISCKNQTPDCGCLGPLICPPSDFKIETFEVQNDKVDLSDGKSAAVIKFKFNHEVAWKLEIVGKSTNAKKIFTGTSIKDSIIWYGNPETPLFFDAEECEISLKVNCLSEVKKSLTLTQKPNFKGMGFLIADFENNGIVHSDKIGFGLYKWAVYGIKTKSSISDTAAGLGSSPMGGKYFYLANTNKLNSYYSCGSNADTDINENTDFKERFKDINKMYINFFYNTKNNTQTVITPYFKDLDGKIYSLNILNSGEGWKFASYKVTDFKSSGASITGTDQIYLVGFDLGTFEKGPKFAEFAVDFIIFTEGEPFIKSPNGQSTSSSSTSANNPFDLNSNNIK